MVGGRYDPIIGVRDVPLKTSQLTTFGPWKRVNSMLQAFGIYQMTRPNPPYTPPEAVTDAGEHTTLQPIQL